MLVGKQPRHRNTGEIALKPFPFPSTAANDHPVADRPSDEVPLTFNCNGDTLVGVLHRPAAPPELGVVIVVGGPQYRVGSHRQFILLARNLAGRGIAALRFDCRGMGDSDGEFRGFENIEPDIAAAIDTMTHELPSLRRIVLWGLCDATLAICIRARRDRRVGGIVLVNPWVRTLQSEARAQLRHYYLARLIQREFLRKILSGEFNPVRAGRDLLGNLVKVFRQSTPDQQSGGSNPLAERMATELQHFSGNVLLIVSGRDMTAREFDDAIRQSKSWRQLCASARVTRRDFPDADHTFSRREWRDTVADWTQDWVRSLIAKASAPGAQTRIL